MRRDVSLTDKLRMVRKVTGDKFSSAAGYDLRKGLSKRRQKTVEKYFEMLVELTARPHQVITPPKGAKREVFEFTGQKKHPRFAKAFVHVPDPAASYTYELDRSRPKGSRFVVVNEQTGERMWHIPPEVFLELDPELYEDGEEPDAGFFEDVIRTYGERGEVYVIQAGNYHMWGTAGTPSTVADQLARLFKDYGAGNFNDRDPNSHWVGNWFRGVEVFGDASDFAPYFDERVKAKARRDAERQTAHPFQKIRRLKSGDIGIFERGRLAQVIRSETIPAPKGGRRRRR